MLRNCTKLEILRIREWLLFPMMNQKKQNQTLRNETRKQIAIEKRRFYDNELGNSYNSKKNVSSF